MSKPFTIFFSFCFLYTDQNHQPKWFFFFQCTNCTETKLGAFGRCFNFIWPKKGHVGEKKIKTPDWLVFNYQSQFIFVCSTQNDNLKNLFPLLSPKNSRCSFICIISLIYPPMMSHWWKGDVSSHIVFFYSSFCFSPVFLEKKKKSKWYTQHWFWEAAQSRIPLLRGNFSWHCLAINSIENSLRIKYWVLNPS